MIWKFQMRLSSQNSHSPVSNDSLTFHRGCVEFKWSCLMLFTSAKMVEGDKTLASLQLFHHRNILQNLQFFISLKTFQSLVMQQMLTRPNFVSDIKRCKTLMICIFYHFNIRWLNISRWQLASNTKYNVSRTNAQYDFVLNKLLTHLFSPVCTFLSTFFHNHLYIFGITFMDWYDLSKGSG